MAVSNLYTGGEEEYEMDAPAKTTQPNVEPVSKYDDDVDLSELTVYERKALLVNRELDSHGMGRYQWCIWILCGFGYFIDLMWAQAFGLVTPSLQNELGFPADEYGNIFSAFSAGLTAGAFVWGVLVDILGRRWAFNLTVLFASIFGLCLGIPSDYNSILVLTAFVGFGVGGNIPIDTTICLEFLPQRKRFLLALLSIFQPLGVVVMSGIAYGLVPKYACMLPNGDTPPACSLASPGEQCCTKASNMGWRYTLYVTGAITLFVFFLRFVVFRFQESPKFLIYRGQDDKAIEVLENIARFNKRQCNLTLADFQALDREVATPPGSQDSGDSETPALGSGAIQRKAAWHARVKLELVRYKLLFNSFTATRLTLLTWIAYIFDYWAFSVAGSFLPNILLEKNKAIDVSTAETYRNFVIIYLPGIVGVALGALMYSIPFVGRKWGMVGSATLMGISLFLFATVDTEASNIGLNLMEYFFQSMYNAILYGWTPEVFPAPIRGTACGLASFWGRLFSIIAPIIAEKIIIVSLNGVLYMAGAAALVSGLAIALLPNQNIGLQSY